MHLYVIHLPEMELAWHLHPERDPAEATRFTQPLPAMAAGRYALYGDIVHANGVPETVTTEIELAAIQGSPLAGDDSTAAGPALANADYNRSVTTLSGGYRMVWDRDAQPLHARRPYLLRFRVEDPGGKPASGMELYMGMQGHAAIVGADRTVFAHIHPSGSVPMPSLQLAQPDILHAGHNMMQPELPAEVSFPYGFPKPGGYRLFVQVKRAGGVLSGVFDAQVEN
jgi:hypothetical protein